MSDNIPYEIQAEIIKRLPVKSLVQFRSVSKQWKSLIDSSEFLAAYNIYHNQPQRLIVWYEYPVDTEEKYVSFVDDETFAKQGFAVSLPVLAKVLSDSRVVGSSQGLLCLYGYYRVPGHSRHNSVRQMAVLWNPSIRKSVGVAVPGVLRWGLETILGFGVCPIRSDPMIVKITQVNLNWEIRSRASVPWVVEVFSLSKGSWRILSSNLPNKSMKVTWSEVVIDRFIFWFAFDKLVAADGGFSTKNMIMSFDMTTEEFIVVDLPENLANQSYMNLSISKNLFKKLFTINAPYASIRVLGFTKSGEPMMEVKDYYKEAAALVVYQPSLGYINNIGISGNYGSFFVGYYMETLLLLDQADCSVYSNIHN
ncbi:unnamed protein product [Lactuca virosa]|uniref:F-box domain-containing protein n=1 Tax=Lactuca virosa TaxID=75947 RepID=A0AAU9N9R5_9ASTR|nr:unnamed protein product [Lactuca virosa]